MNRPIYCFVFLGLPYFALAISRSGIRTFASRDVADDAVKLMTGEQNSLIRRRYEGLWSSNDVDNFRYKRADDPSSAADDSSPTTESSVPPATDDEPMTDVRWITYLFLLAIALLFLLLAAVVLSLAYYILSTRILNKTTCKEIELQCRCDDCDKDNDDC